LLPNFLQPVPQNFHCRSGVGALGPRSMHGRIRSLLVGAGAIGVEAARRIRQDPRQVLIGAIDCRPQLQMAPAFPDVSVLGKLHELAPLIVEHCIDRIEVALPMRSCPEEFSSILDVAKALGIPVNFHLELLDGQPVKVEVDSRSVLLSYNEHPSNRWPNRFIVRVVNIVVAAIILMLTSPLFLLIAIAVKLTSAGPVFFKQPRVGLRRREFKMWKFRTMVKNAEQLRKQVQGLNNAKGISFKIVRDPRLTRIGGFLRRTSLDELPQLINVLLGDMSLVGPRPIPVWVADQLQYAAYYRRFHVMPGITGWWQVEGRQQDFDVMAEQDLYYLDNWSLLLDFKILLRTLPAVMRGHGAH
jgi:exopolysaccharide biosynthesis polyprenyl glycosylphosphotransferase